MVESIRLHSLMLGSDGEFPQSGPLTLDSSGAPSSLVNSYPGYSATVVAHNDQVDSIQFPVSATFDYTVQGTANANFISNETVLRAVYFDRSWETSFSQVFDSHTQSNQDIYSFFSNNVAHYTYVYDSANPPGATEPPIIPTNPFVNFTPKPA